MTMTLPDFSGQNVGHYRITSPLSSGATSCVFAAVDTEQSGRYAIKCISKFELTPKQLLNRTSEVFHHQLVTGCSPHVLPLHEIINEDLYLFIVFKLCEGDLHQAIWDLRVYQRNDALIKETFIDILDGVYACHSRGVFHRDLKPANILFEEYGSGIRIADFGIATRKRICRGIRCGSSPYMGPEQWSDGETVFYPSLTDIWALGIILINMVTGRRPWKIAHESDPSFRAFLEDGEYLYKTFPISRQLDEVLRWILRPNPMDRPQIPQIWRAILNIDTFYRNPYYPSSSDNATPEKLKDVALCPEEHPTDGATLESLPDQDVGRGEYSQDDSPCQGSRDDALCASCLIQRMRQES